MQTTVIVVKGTHAKLRKKEINNLNHSTKSNDAKQVNIYIKKILQ